MFHRLKNWPTNIRAFETAFEMDLWVTKNSSLLLYLVTVYVFFIIQDQTYLIGWGFWFLFEYFDIVNDKLWY